MPGRQMRMTNKKPDKEFKDENGICAPENR